ncbi:pinin/SDK/memA/ protein conserved region-domain-containing protein [Pilaira anomala]|nr:pinin/SDK/memA/ protein conserved region-domain-containing protein [Pilaira anomala]
MVQSSIVVPSSSTRKRSLDLTNKAEKNSTADEEIKRPRLELNEAGKSRNKRLFGALLGTLNKFKDETEKTSEVDKNRREINEKLHEKLEKERRELSEKLRARREEKERKLEEENKLEREKEKLRELYRQEKLANFLVTETKPALYYLPEKLTDEMVLIIAKQKKEIRDQISLFESKDTDMNDPLPRDDEDTAMTDDEK